MTGQGKDRSQTFRIDLWVTIAAQALALLMIILATQLHAQTFTVLHNFTDGLDGGSPHGALTLDARGNLYGTTSIGAVKSGHCYPFGCGGVFELKHTKSGWLFNPLYIFEGKTDSGGPYASVTFGRDGTLYSTASGAGTGACGTVFNLKPPPAACTSTLCFWNITVIHSFEGSGGGCAPYSNVIFDEAGNLYGTSLNPGSGNVYELSPSNGTWSESVLTAFNHGDGAYPGSGVVFDQAGNLYGTTSAGGDNNCLQGLGCGVVYQLTPSSSSWTNNTLYEFQGGSDGTTPEAGVVVDASGKVYGTTTGGGSGAGGTVFELSPFNGYWTFNLLYSLTGGNQNVGGAWGTLVMDSAGILYGTTANGGSYFEGAVFKLTPSNGGWTYTSLHDFVCSTDGCEPYDGVIFDANGNIYGTAGAGGAYDYGTVWEITP
jgi:uncharacterized repeat protein (TIGR03803 family)